MRAWATALVLLLSLPVFADETDSKNKSSAFKCGMGYRQITESILVIVDQFLLGKDPEFSKLALRIKSEGDKMQYLDMDCEEIESDCLDRYKLISKNAFDKYSPEYIKSEQMNIQALVDIFKDKKYDRKLSVADANCIHEPVDF